MTIGAYVVYTLLSVTITIWVASTLFRNGRVFLVESFKNEQMADSVNKLLVVGFYLVNLGFVSLFLKYGEKPNSTLGAIEYVSTKIGIVLLALGLWHFLNMFNLAKVYKKSRHRKKKEEQGLDGDSCNLPTV